MTQEIWWWGSSNAGALGNAEYPFIVIAPVSTQARLFVVPDRIPTMAQIEPNRGFLSFLFFAFKLRVYGKQNCLR